MISHPDLSIEQLQEGKISGFETQIEIKKTTCAICSANCGIDASVKDGVVIKVEGTAENPANKGTLCSKGAANRQYIYHEDRIRTPLLKRGGKNSTEFEPISWDQALDIISSRMLEIKDQSGPESVVFFSGFPKRLRPFLKRLAHGFGSPNYCTESSTCFYATLIANKLNYGCAGEADIQNSECLLVWSTNPFHSATADVSNLLDAIDTGLKIIEVGPLITPLSSHADIHLRIRPGTSGALALGMAHVIIEEGLYDSDFVNHWTVGFDEYRKYTKQFTPSATEEITSVPAASIIQAARLYASSKTSSLMSGASPTVHHTNGVQNHRAITALIGLTGNFDRKGGNRVIPSSHYGFNTRQDEFEQSKPWSEMAPRIAQEVLPVWSELVEQAQAIPLPAQIHSGKPYPIRAMLAFGLNYRMWPGSDNMKESLKKLDFLVDIDLFLTDSAKLADLVLPACTSFEKNDLRVWSPNYAIWTEPVIKPVGESRSDINIIIDLADKLGLDDPLLKQGQEACLDWIIKPSGFTISDLKAAPGGMFLPEIETPFFQYKEKGFPTPSGKMEFCSSILKKAGYDALPKYVEPKHSPVSAPEMALDYPLILNTGSRLPMFMHSRTFRLPWTRALRHDPMADINPIDGERRDIKTGDTIKLSTHRSSITVKAHITQRVPPGVVAMFHAYPEADVNLLIEPDYCDPISGYPGFKSLLCEVTKIMDD